IGYVWHRLKQETGVSLIGRAIRVYLLLSVLASVCLLSIFLFTWINDPLGTRFILFLPLTLFCSAASLLGTCCGIPPSARRPYHRHDRRSPGQPITWAFTSPRPYFIFACLAAVAAIRLAHWTTYVDPFARDFRITTWRPGERYPDGAYRDFAIDPQVTGGQP